MPHVAAGRGCEDHDADPDHARNEAKAVGERVREFFALLAFGRACDGIDADLDVHSVPP